jgi:very-short-patch-repair endonuclease
MRNKVLNNDYYKEKFIKKSNIRHKNKYDYSKVIYINSLTKVEVLCKEHGSFFVRPDAHVRKVGCPFCNGGIRYDNNTFIEKSNIVHNFEYDYSSVQYINSSSKVDIICRKHGKFSMSPRNHLMGQKCPKCAGVKRKTTDEFIKEASIIHNFKYDYSITNYLNNLKKVDIICKKHGIFSQSPKDHLKGHGCIKCSNFSNGEKRLENILNDIGVSFIREYKFDGCVSKNGVKLPFDFFLPKFNIVIEYDGKQHFESVNKFGGESSFLNLKDNDSIRNNWCLENNIKIIRIPHYDEENSISDLLNILNKEINKNYSQINFDSELNKLESSRFDVSRVLNVKEDIFNYLNNSYHGDIIKNYKIKGYILDFYLPNENLGFRILSHFKNSEINSNWKDQKNVSNLDIKVVQIFEDLWINKKDIIKYRLNNILKLNKKIGSRECEIVNIDSKESMKFLNDNHLQGGVGASVRIGLKYNGELVSIMTFGKMRKNLGSKNKEDEWELIRFCNKGNLSVIGSASRLFKHFIKLYNPTKIVSYADKLWSNYQNVYNNLGMEKVHESKPSYFYILGDKRVGRFSLRKDVLVSMGYSPEFTEKEICYNNKVYRIYDAGTFKYQWLNTKS